MRKIRRHAFESVPLIYLWEEKMFVELQRQMVDKLSTGPENALRHRDNQLKALRQQLMNVLTYVNGIVQDIDETLK